jgi:hypothetical protein
MISDSDSVSVYCICIVYTLIGCLLTQTELEVMEHARPPHHTDSLFFTGFRLSIDKLQRKRGGKGDSI